MKRYFEYIDDKSSKFWQIEIINNKLYKTYGKIGTKGVTKEHINPNQFSPELELTKECSKKYRKGYIEKDIDKINNDKPLSELIKQFQKIM